MRVANYDGRLVLITSEIGGQLEGARAIEVHRASDGTIPAEPDRAYGAASNGRRTTGTRCGRLPSSRPKPPRSRSTAIR